MAPLDVPIATRPAPARITFTIPGTARCTGAAPLRHHVTLPSMVPVIAASPSSASALSCPSTRPSRARPPVASVHAVTSPSLDTEASRAPSSEATMLVTAPPASSTLGARGSSQRRTSPSPSADSSARPPIAFVAPACFAFVASFACFAPASFALALAPSSNARCRTRALCPSNVRCRPLRRSRIWMMPSSLAVASCAPSRDLASDRTCAR